ncbi:MAG: gamma-glutamyltransferase [Thermomicrobiales bacterium]
MRLARKGFEISPYVDPSAKTGTAPRDSDRNPGYPSIMEKLRATPAAGAIYLKDGEDLYTAGDWLVQERLADTLQQLADAGGLDFYDGDIGQSIAGYLESHEGFISADDLRNYRIDDLEPLFGEYRGFQVASTPAGSGAHLIEMLQILDHLDPAELDHNSPGYIDTVSRVFRATFADNVALKCMDFREAAPLERDIIALERAAAWAERIAGGDRVVVRSGEAVSGTTHLSAIDEQGNVVTFTHSVGALGGSGVVAPELGFMFNDFLGHFNPLPGHANSISPGKKMVGGAPAILFRDGQPHIIIGAPGGSRILTAMTQTIVNAIDHKMDLERAVSVLRFHSEEDQLIFVEPELEALVAGPLADMGNEVQPSSYMSRVQAIRVGGDGELEAGSDPRAEIGIGRHP